MGSAKAVAGTAAEPAVAPAQGTAAAPAVAGGDIAQRSQPMARLRTLAGRPEQITEKTAAGVWTEDHLRYLVGHSIQWHASTLFGSHFDLLVVVPGRLRGRLTAQQVGEAAAAVFAAGTGLTLLDGGAGLAREVATTVESYELLEHRAFRVTVASSTMRQQVAPAAYDAFLAGLNEDFGFGLITGPLIAAGSFGEGGAGGALGTPPRPARPRKPAPAERKSTAPAWAHRLLAELKRRLAALRRAEPGATDLPDGVALDGGDRVFLRVWVERGESRNDGSAPLTEATTADELIPYVRRVTAVLRQFERAEPPSDAEVTLDGPVDLLAFPARLEQIDLRPDQITVTGARNEFRMVLDLDYRYDSGSGPAKDYFVASKLHQQYIHYFWEVHPAPAAKAGEPTDWASRWNRLSAAKQRPDVSRPVFRADGSDMVSRVTFPAPGEYLVRCVTGHAPIGEHRLRRRSSEAFYPVKVIPIREAGAAVAGRRPAATRFAETELAAIPKMLADPGLDPARREMLLAKQRARIAYLERLGRRERQSLAESTAGEIRYAEQQLALVTRLLAALPTIEREAADHGVRPSDLLIDRPDLLDLYWYLAADGRAATGYQEQLTAEIKNLRQLAGRLAQFDDVFQSGSPYRYNLEAAFVSRLTGQTYPLTLALGEAPRNEREGRSSFEAPGPAVAYRLVDVTATATKREYRGESYQGGPAGHREAIRRAFEDFGAEAVYGEGVLAVRIPPGPAGGGDPNHPGAGMHYYDSEMGVVQEALRVLAVVAAVAGAAALIASGAGAPVAAAVLGTVAGVAGAVTSVHNIAERSRRRTLALDAELALDVIGIIGVVPAIAGTKVALAARTAAGFERVVVTARYLEIYGWAEGGLTLMLLPVAFAQDVQRIKADTELTDDQKTVMIDQLKLGLLQTGLMILGSSAASRAGAVAGENADLMRQSRLLGMEDIDEYRSMHDRGWVDEKGAWADPIFELNTAAKKPGGTETPAATTKPPADEEATPAKPAQPAEEKPAAGGDPAKEQQRRRLGAIEDELAEVRRELAAVSALEGEGRRISEERARLAQERENLPEVNKRIKALRERAKEIRDELATRDAAATLNERTAKLEKRAKVIRTQLDPKTRAPIPCFEGDTPVHTPGGRVRIDTLRAGDLVLARDGTGQVLPCRVTAVHRNRTRHFYRISTPAGVVRATARHPFRVVDEDGWVAARDLRPGMKLDTLRGAPAEVLTVDLDDDLDATSHNLTVAGASTFFVGEGLLVHNQDVYDMGFGGEWIIYQGTNERFPGVVYIGQTTEHTKKGKARGTTARGGEHREDAAKEWAALEEIRKTRPLTPDELELHRFFDFMRDVELKPLVKGIPNPALADYLEQFNMDLERQHHGPKRLINRIRKITSASHMRETLDKIAADPRLAPFCPK
ncbi:polymorphic toxin-type HINT domain-containing protein [Actinoplanes sp. NPDC051861]|uniref:Hint domain-containing protein n=1 Tax=Actinoplanes sp. NPDC051861 TaxID=3155170 RepID=UPI00341E82A7